MGVFIKLCLRPFYVQTIPAGTLTEFSQYSNKIVDWSVKMNAALIVFN